MTFQRVGRGRKKGDHGVEPRAEASWSCSCVRPSARIRLPEDDQIENCDRLDQGSVSLSRASDIVYFQCRGIKIVD